VCSEIGSAGHVQPLNQDGVAAPYWKVEFVRLVREYGGAKISGVGAAKEDTTGSAMILTCQADSAGEECYVWCYGELGSDYASHEQTDDGCNDYCEDVFLVTVWWLRGRYVALLLVGVDWWIVRSRDCRIYGGLSEVCSAGWTVGC
jgi:hypothetical protein